MLLIGEVALIITTQSIMRSIRLLLLALAILRAYAMIDTKLSEAAWQTSLEPDSKSTMQRFTSNTCFSRLMHELANDGSCSQLLNNLAQAPTEAQTLRQTIAFQLTQCHYFSVDRPCSKCLEDKFDVSCVRQLSDAEFGIYTEFLSGEISLMDTMMLSSAWLSSQHTRLTLACASQTHKIFAFMSLNHFGVLK